MDRFLDRIQVSSAENDPSGRATDADSSGTVEWRDISIRRSATESKPAKESPRTTDIGADLESLGSEQLLTTVLDGLSTPALIADSDGAVAYLNRPACILFDTTASTAVGRPSAALHDGAALVPQVVSTGEPVRNHRETVTVGESQYDLLRTVVPFSTQAGTIVGAMETIRGQRE